MGKKKERKLHSVRKLNQDADFFAMNEVGGNMKHKELSVDVIIPTYRPDHKFDFLMKRLKEQTIQPRNIIILNTVPSKYETGEGMREQEEFMRKYREQYHASIHHIKQVDFDHGGTRAFGASLSDADLLLFMTQDAIPADESLVEEIMKPFQDSNVAAAYARQLAQSDADEIESFTRIFNYPAKSRIKSKADLEQLGIKTYFCSNVCACYRRSVYEQLGGFVHKTIFNEDMIYASKVIENDYSIAYVATARVFHSHHYSYRQQFSRNFDLAVSHAQYPEAFKQGKSESEGIKLVLSTVNHLIKRHSYFKVVDLFFMSAFKYAGFYFGKRYKKLPKKLVLKWTMNKGYWTKK